MAWAVACLRLWLASEAMLVETVVRELSITIRPCTREDLVGLEWWGQFSEHRGIFAEAFERHERGENVMLVADLKGSPIGQAWVDLGRYDDGTALLWAVRVFPALQGLGLGTRLIAAAERAAAARGARRVELSVETTNDGALRLYRSLGYDVVGEVVEPWRYVTPDGRTVETQQALRVLRKDLPIGAAPASRPAPS